MLHAQRGDVLHRDVLAVQKVWASRRRAGSNKPGRIARATAAAAAHRRRQQQVAAAVAEEAATYVAAAQSDSSGSGARARKRQTRARTLHARTQHHAVLPERIIIPASRGGAPPRTPQ